MRVLVCWPPHVPTYFNAGHRLPLFTVAAYLRRQAVVSEVITLDAGALNATWKEIADLLLTGGFDLVAVMNEFGVAEPVRRLAQYGRQLSPASRLITFGRLSTEVPDLFRRHGLDAIVCSGDYEAGVAAYARSLGDPGEPPAGVSVAADGRWSEPPPGRFLDPEEWPFPDVTEVPYEAYDRLYRDDRQRFCGIPDRRELVVPVARGCPVNCSFCEVPRQQGLRERRRSVAAVLGFMDDSFARLPFEYAAMYAPTFTLDRPWVAELCTTLIARGAPYRWKCATTVHHLDEDLVALMGRSGCVRISVGVETLDPPARATLPRLKRLDESRLAALAAWCTASGIELNCFVIIGMPGQSLEGARYTMEQLRALGARVRPTIFTPYHEMSPALDEQDVTLFDRHYLHDQRTDEERLALYRLAFGLESGTRVEQKIPRREA
jgi:anaerobic magnesium-protoporphyrin IX monomethyl ester cyclase